MYLFNVFKYRFFFLLLCFNMLKSIFNFKWNSLWPRLKMCGTICTVLFGLGSMPRCSTKPTNWYYKYMQNASNTLRVSLSLSLSLRQHTTHIHIVHRDISILLHRQKLFTFCRKFLLKTRFECVVLAVTPHNDQHKICTFFVATFFITQCWQDNKKTAFLPDIFGYQLRKLGYI